MASVAVMLISLASDPAGLPSWTAYPAIALLLSGIGAIVRFSINGTITWPPEKTRMEKTIAEQALALKNFTDNATRSIPTTARVVELVEQRIIPGSTASPSLEEELLSALAANRAELVRLRDETETRSKGRGSS